MADLNGDGIDDGRVVERTTVVNTDRGGGSGGVLAIVLLLVILVVGYLLWQSGALGGSKTEVKVPDSINVNVN